MSTFNSDVELFSLMKQGTTCVIGNASRGIQWPMILSDFLLIQSIKSNKYSKVIYVLNDRFRSEIEKSLSPLKSTNSGILPISYVESSHTGSFKCDEIFECIKSEYDHLSVTKPSKPAIIFLSSLSEMILNSEQYEVYKFIECLSKLGIQHIITTLHQTMHPSTTINYFTSLFNTVAHIVPNDGTLSNEVAVQINTTRKSPSTGRVSESSELFGFHPNSILRPLKTQRHSSDNDSNAKTEYNSKGEVQLMSPAIVAAAADSLTKISFERQGEHLASPLDVNPTTDSFQQYQNSNDSSIVLPVSKRLITFDSTDPEFDEDSDPDNDLDL